MGFHREQRSTTFEDHVIQNQSSYDIPKTGLEIAVRARFSSFRVWSRLIITSEIILSVIMVIAGVAFSSLSNLPMKSNDSLPQCVVRGSQMMGKFRESSSSRIMLRRRSHRNVVHHYDDRECILQNGMCRNERIYSALNLTLRLCSLSVTTSTAPSFRQQE